MEAIRKLGGLTATGRAAWRFVKFVGVTGARLAVAAPTVALSRTPGLTSASQSHDWGRSLAKHFGVEVVRETPPPAAAAVIVANHRSYIDICALLSEVPASFTAKAEVARWPFMGYAASVGGTIFVDRKDAKSRDRTRQIVRERLDQGVCMVVFPEGTSSAGPGVLDFRPGIFRLAAEGGFPVLPVAIWYEAREDAWVGEDTFVGHFLRVFRKPAIRVHVAYGPPMTDTDPEKLRSAAWTWIRDNLKDDPDAAAQAAREDP
ncbi:MAG: 1-acyl-sn-glycerol-3-phosphate acyltransferase [Deltaproteobacteria bacterium]|nr:1-acyl-sn-glycerol-3-phosphate acyltransferase [Deltaproteobacteria bacterium]